MKRYKKIFEGKKYVVKKSFWLDEYDTDTDEWTNKTTKVKKGKYYYLQEEDYRICGGEIRLENSQGWIEITKEHFEEFFIEVKED